MNRYGSPIFVAFTDLMICLLIYALLAVTMTKKTDAGQKLEARYIITIDWPSTEDEDADSWLLTPKGPVSYASRQQGLVTLDTDNKGFADAVVTLVDGRTTRIVRDEEIISIRGNESGHYDHGVNLFGYRVNGEGQGQRKDLGLKVHVELKANDPPRLLWSGDETLDWVGQTVNTVSFDIANDGTLTLSDTPLSPITSAYMRRATP